jgi:beta-aspartyl-peptidase (threonine type)
MVCFALLRINFHFIFSTGAVGAVRHIKNPISLAKLVKDGSEHVLIVGHEAELFALNHGVRLVPTSDLIARWNDTYHVAEDFSVVVKDPPRDKRGTVGAVAINSKGQIFAGTSTGGMSGKLNGRLGDAPIVGCGTLADDLIAGISATGWGEAFIRYRVASRVADLIERGKKMG